VASLREEIAELRRQRDGLLAEVDRLKADLAARDARIAESGYPLDCHTPKM
jgi:uncharacterized coiled-coil DUF342 family protein